MDCKTSDETLNYKYDETKTFADNLRAQTALVRAEKLSVYTTSLLNKIKNECINQAKLGQKICIIKTPIFMFDDKTTQRIVSNFCEENKGGISISEWKLSGNSITFTLCWF